MFRPPMTLIFTLSFMSIAAPHVAAEPRIDFQKQNDGLDIRLDGKPLARYTFRDNRILRPYLCNVRTPGGVQVTRRHPPRPDQELADHPTMHPGIWLAFGDIEGVDFWRNKGRVRHVAFSDITPGDKEGCFTVKNEYLGPSGSVCLETCRIRIAPRPHGYFIIWESTFHSEKAFAFGDQEEMGLGLRVATPLAVVKGGQILDSAGRKNGRQVWGKQADWCQYSGKVNGKPVGAILMPDPNNFRPCWFHARDYGLLAANPFGRRAFTRGPPSRIEVKPGQALHLRFGLFIHDGTPDIQPIYRDYLQFQKQAAAGE